MAWGAVAVAGATLVGSMLNRDAASSAADAQMGAANMSAQVQREIYNQQRADSEPWRKEGEEALKQIHSNMNDFTRDFTLNDFQADPGYRFRMAEANKALERSAAARGGLMSGGTLKAISNYNQDASSQEYQNAYNRFNADRDRRFNRLSALAGTGQTANSQLAASGSNFANNYGNAISSAANAQAAGTIGQANAISNGIGQGMNTWMNYQMMNKFAPKG